MDWNEWKWPIENNKAGYVLARALPHISLWHSFSPEKIAKLAKKPIEKPNPTSSNHTNSTKLWTVPIPRISGVFFILLILQYITGYAFILESNLQIKRISPQH